LTPDNDIIGRANTG